MLLDPGLQAQVGLAELGTGDTVEDALVAALAATGNIAASNAKDLNKISWSRSSRTDKGMQTTPITCNLIRRVQSEEIAHRDDSRLNISKTTAVAELNGVFHVTGVHALAGVVSLKMETKAGHDFSADPEGISLAQVSIELIPEDESSSRRFNGVLLCTYLGGLLVAQLQNTQVGRLTAVSCLCEARTDRARLLQCDFIGSVFLPIHIGRFQVAVAWLLSTGH